VDDEFLKITKLLQYICTLNLALSLALTLENIDSVEIVLSARNHTYSDNMLQF